MTWPEVKQVIKEERIAVVPVAIIEEHGYHLPVDTDLVLVSEVCTRTGRKIPGEMVLIPPVNHGYAPHQMDFPGVISISGETFTRYVTDVCMSLACQGFKKSSWSMVTEAIYHSCKSQPGQQFWNTRM